MSTTTDLSKFGTRELEILSNILLRVSTQGFPKGFELSDVQPRVNTISGKVFLTNSDYQVCMGNDYGRLELWHILPHSGEEGFLDDLVESLASNIGDFNYDDVEYVVDCLKDGGFNDTAHELQNAYDVANASA